MSFDTERREEVAKLIASAESMVQTALKSCLSCGHFVEKDEQCQLFRQRPPARVIAFGCEHYDYIPF